MATPQLSPGILVREVDLTVGRVDNVVDNTGAIAAPFSSGPVEEPVLINNEKELINVFGKPSSKDNHYEYWMSASSYLSYGGNLRVIRCDDQNFKNSSVGYNTTDPEIKIKNFDHYNEQIDTSDYHFASRTPGTWANGLKVCVVDDIADQIISFPNSYSLNNLGVTVGYGVTISLVGRDDIGIGVTNKFDGYLKGVVTGVNTSPTSTPTIDLKIVSKVSAASTSYITVLNTNATFSANVGVKTVYLNNTTGINTTSVISFSNSGNKKLAISSVGSTSITLQSNLPEIIPLNDVALVEELITTEGEETVAVYSKGSKFEEVLIGDSISFIDTDGNYIGTSNAIQAIDWYDQQTLDISNNVIYWSSIAPKPVTTQYASQRGSRNDSIHIAVVDDSGSISGIKGNLLEKHISLSKSSDAISAVNSPQNIYFRNYLANYSEYVYAGGNTYVDNDTTNNVFPVSTNLKNNITATSTEDGNWGTLALNKIFNCIGNKSFELSNGKDYTGNGFKASLGSLKSAYEMFKNSEEYDINYVISGPSLDNMQESQAKAKLVIDVADYRKDCIAVISPYRSGVVGQTNKEIQTKNIIDFFAPLGSSSYAIFDSGYKYTYDRFNNTFRYIPCNADVAGLISRLDVNGYPWYSPAGQQRGILNSAIKLAYNPSKFQRDALYASRINPIINQPGVGIFLFGDKTALSYASAFDRINVRKLFLTVEEAIKGAARTQLFELNDSTTRANFVNIVEPYLRDVQAKRGVYDFVVVCDETNNTPDIIDNNEFRADIFLKPTRSINYITLTFVATRTGVSFSEVVGTV
jgi:hypothetical protein